MQVHDGFQKTFERTADGVLSGVQNALSSTGANKVLVTGHSLGKSDLLDTSLTSVILTWHISGAAVAAMDALMLKMILPSSVEMTATLFGLPRGGNQEYADFIDSAVSDNLSSYL